MKKFFNKLKAHAALIKPRQALTVAFCAVCAFSRPISVNAQPSTYVNARIFQVTNSVTGQALVSLTITNATTNAFISAPFRLLRGRGVGLAINAGGTNVTSNTTINVNLDVGWGYTSATNWTTNYYNWAITNVPTSMQGVPTNGNNWFTNLPSAQFDNVQWVRITGCGTPGTNNQYINWANFILLP